MEHHCQVLLCFRDLLSDPTEHYILFAKLLLVQLCMRSISWMEDWRAMTRLTPHCILETPMPHFEDAIEGDILYLLDRPWHFFVTVDQYMLSHL